eukprot:9302723-Pyramimonas_sp.AAC.1
MQILASIVVACCPRACLKYCFRNVAVEGTLHRSRLPLQVQAASSTNGKWQTNATTDAMEYIVFLFVQHQ